jgi:hypothetical protein
MKAKGIVFLALIFAATACKKDALKTADTSDVASDESSVKATWSSTDKWGRWSNGGYYVGNNVWGANPGPQSIWANSYSNWGVWCNHTGSGIKSYPNSSRYVGRTLSSLSSLRSSFSATTPSGGAWASAYDIWDNNKRYETMLWMNYTGSADGCGNVRPISYSWSSSGCAVPAYRNVNVGGHTWNVFRGANGSITVFSFLRTSKTNSATIDILAIQRWIQARGWFGNITMGEVQYGFEISTTNGGANFTSNSYSVSFN